MLLAPGLATPAAPNLAALPGRSEGHAALVSCLRWGFAGLDFGLRLWFRFWGRQIPWRRSLANRAIQQTEC
eukprot:5887025-Alexandrium_andersonii.AAC.1